MKKLRLEITSKSVKKEGRKDFKEFFMTRKYEDPNIEDETIPLEFHMKHCEARDPFKLYKEEQKKKEEALDKPLEFIKKSDLTEVEDEQDSDS